MRRLAAPCWPSFAKPEGLTQVLRKICNTPELKAYGWRSRGHRACIQRGSDAGARPASGLAPAMCPTRRGADQLLRAQPRARQKADVARRDTRARHAAPLAVEPDAPP